MTTQWDDEWAQDLADAEGINLGDEDPTGSTGSTGLTGFQTEADYQPDGAALDATRKWLARFVCTVDQSDLDLLALWAAHTHFIDDVYTTPRLLIDSPVPDSGKTTVIEHLERLCVRAVQMATISSPAMLTRLLEFETRTILIDEADRSLNPDKDGIGDLLAVLNSGYKRGATRPVLVPVKGGGWTPKELPTYAPVAMAGNNPKLPDDTKSRVIRVLLVPDLDGEAEESDWELIEHEADEVGAALADWAARASMYVRMNRPRLPESVRGRAKERWSPLKRVAVAAGGRWSEVVDELAVKDVLRIKSERDEGITQQRPHVILLSDIAAVWPDGESFVSTNDLLGRLIDHNRQMWGVDSTFSNELTAQRMGRMLVGNYNIHSDRRPDDRGPGSRGYVLAKFMPAFKGLGISLPWKPVKPVEPVEPDKSGW
jgi:hypothetical protein